MLVAFLLMLLCTAAGNVAYASDAVVEEEMNLHAMTDEELEAICVERGFELVKDVDEATGEAYVYTHEDYVHAAKECLAIESEMQRLLEENPEMMDRMKEEAERLTKEKESLEQQLLDAQEKLQGGKDSGDNSIPKEGVAFVNDGGKAQPQRAAFVGSVGGDAEDDEGGDTDDPSPPSAEEEDQTTKEEDQTTKEEDQTTKEEPSMEEDADGATESGDDASVHDDTTRTAGDSDEETIEGAGKETEKETNESGSADKSTEDDNDILKEVLDESSSATEETAVSSSTGSSSSPFREMLGLLQEARERVKNDLEKVGAVLLPHPVRKPLRAALKPVVRVTKKTAVTILDMIKRYVIALLQKTSGETANKEVDGPKGQSEGEPQQQQQPGQA